MHTKIFKGKVRRQLNTSKFSDNFKVIVLKTLRALNVNCAKILAKKYDFLACANSIKKELSNDV